jgi:hypothetical protein
MRMGVLLKMNKSPVNIAIIDDGIVQSKYDIGELEYNIHITAELDICEEGAGNSGLLQSHGTICAAIIKKYSPEAVLSSIKILSSESMVGKKEQLVKALEWCVENDVKLINLSLGTIDFKDFYTVRDAVDNAFKAGIIIIAACSNRDIYTCPASLPNVIGVKCDNSGLLGEGGFIYNCFSPDGIEIIASSRHNLITKSGDTITTSLCNSYAAPRITALVHDILQEIPSATFDQIQDELKKKSKKVYLEKGLYLQETYKKTIKDIYIPIISIYDYTNRYGYEVGFELCKLFRNDGYNAISICSDKSMEDLYSGIVSIEGCIQSKEKEITAAICRIYEIYDPDVIITSYDMSGNNEGIYREGQGEIDSDISILISDTVNANTIKELMESNTIMLLTNPSEKSDFSQKNIFVYLKESKMCDIYIYILKLFET